MNLHSTSFVLQPTIELTQKSQPLSNLTTEKAVNSTYLPEQPSPRGSGRLHGAAEDLLVGAHRLYRVRLPCVTTATAAALAQSRSVLAACR